MAVANHHHCHHHHSHYCHRPHYHNHQDNHGSVSDATGKVYWLLRTEPVSPPSHLLIQRMNEFFWTIPRYPSKVAMAEEVYNDFAEHGADLDDEERESQVLAWLCNCILLFSSNDVN